MEIEKTKLVCVQDEDGGWTVYLAALPALVVEVEDLKDAPDIICGALYDILEFGFKQGIHHIEPCK